MRYLSTYLMAAVIQVACIISTQSRRKIRSIKTLLHICAHALQQPHKQYRIALLLATILAFLLGWPLFGSTLSHASLAFVKYMQERI